MVSQNSLVHDDSSLHLIGWHYQGSVVPGLAVLPLPVVESQQRIPRAVDHPTHLDQQLGPVGEDRSGQGGVQKFLSDIFVPDVANSDRADSP